MQTKVPGVKSVISTASNGKADWLVEPGDKIFFGDLFLEVSQHMFYIDLLSFRLIGIISKSRGRFIFTFKIHLVIQIV